MLPKPIEEAAPIRDGLKQVLGAQVVN